MANVLPACLLLALLLLAPALSAQHERGLIFNLVRGDPVLGTGPSSCCKGHAVCGGLEGSAGFSGVVREFGAWEISSIKGQERQKGDQTEALSCLSQPGPPPWVAHRDWGREMSSLWCLSPTPMSPAKNTALVGGILGQTEETLQRGRLGHVGSGAEPQLKGRARVQHPPKPLGLTARGRSKGNREGPGAQPCLVLQEIGELCLQSAQCKSGCCHRVNGLSLARCAPQAAEFQACSPKSIYGVYYKCPCERGLTCDADKTIVGSITNSDFGVCRDLQDSYRRR
ncbi:colipase [Corvus cornix cornix]|uniref:colipase n=1 Tax=Corvus cornix cornix TaxID=932674 RepID=UPI00194DF3A4|nr:colipase [Corvus cornix cornix]